MNLKHLILSANILISCIVLTLVPVKSYAIEMLFIVANVNDQEQTLTKRDIKNIFLGELRTFPSGEAAKPIVQAIGSQSRLLFMDKIINKTESKWRAHWARLLFTGKGTPPEEISNKNELLEMVSKNKGAVGYFVGNRMESDGVKVLMALPVD